MAFNQINHQRLLLMGSKNAASPVSDSPFKKIYLFTLGIRTKIFSRVMQTVVADRRIINIMFFHNFT